MDEHARYAAYLSTLLGRRRNLSATCWRVVTDPDHVMAEAVLVRWLERAAASVASAEEFHFWLERQESKADAAGEAEDDDSSPLAIHEEKQGKHRIGHNNRIPGRSIREPARKTLHNGPAAVIREE
jgi:hypothetical protein